MKKTTNIKVFLGVDGGEICRHINCIIPPVASVAGREAGSLESASAFNPHETNETARMVGHCETSNEKGESAKRPFGPRPGQVSPTLGANPSFPKKKRPAFAGRRSGDAIPGGVR
jgi:hypothetical protein